MIENITIDTGKLPIWDVLYAMQVSYAEAVVRLQNAISLNEQAQLPDFKYRFMFSDPDSGEKRAVVYNGSDSNDPVDLNWKVAVSILAIIRLKNYTAIYGKSNTIECLFNQGAGVNSKSDMDRILILFEERPEFSLYKLSDNIED